MALQASAQHDMHLAAIMAGVQILRDLNLASEDERLQAVEESRRMLGAIARFRHVLEKKTHHGSLPM